MRNVDVLMIPTGPLWRMVLLLAICSITTPGSAQGLRNGLAVISPPQVKDTPPKDAQRERITIALKNKTIKDAIDEVSRRAKMRAVYSNTPLLARRVTLTLEDTAVMDAIAAILKGTGMSAKLAPDGSTVMIRAPQPAALPDSGQAKGTIQGMILDSVTGDGIQGATVSVQGTTLSASTSEQGRFVLRDVPDGTQTINIKAFGYKPVTRTVAIAESRNANIRVVLTASSTLLTSVVTTATGKQRRLEVGSDISTINVDSVRQTAPITSVTDLLETRVPGLTVVRASGTPGDPARLRLRGASSIQRSNNPIVIVDGVRMYYADQDLNTAGGVTSFGLPAGAAYSRPSALDQIDPASIETIEVFKGPSASALYGSDAANGVIVITTKRGRPGPVRWSATAKTGVSHLPGSYPTMGFGFGHLVNGGNGAGLACDASIRFDCVMDSLVAFQALNDPRYSPFGHGGTSSVDATITGGVNNLRYTFTGSAQDDRGMARLPTAAREQYRRFAGVEPPGWMLHPDKYKAYGVSNKLTISLSPSLQIDVTNSLRSTDQQRSSLGMGSVGQLIGKFVDTTRLNTTALLSAFSEQVTASTTMFMTSAQLNWQVRPWMQFNATAGLNQNGNTDKGYLPSGLPTQLRLRGDSAGRYALSRLTASVRTADIRSVFIIPLTGQRTMNLSAGLNVRGQTTQGARIETDEIPIGVSDPSTFAYGATTANQTTSATSTYGWYLEPRLNLFSRFFIAPGFRLDGGSASGSNAGFTGFPKMNLSWVAYDQSDATAGGQSLLRWLTMLRLRGAYGYAGVQPGPADRLRLTRQQSVILNGRTPIAAVMLHSMGNTQLRPERSTEVEVGFDTELWDSRLSLSLTAFQKRRLDAMLSVPTAPSVGGGRGGTGVLSGSPGWGVRTVNIGTVRNTGLEMSGAAQLIRTAPLQWDVNFSLSRRTNVLTSKDPNAYNSSPGFRDARLVEGYPIDGIWSQSLTGYADLNQDGVLTRNEIVIGDSAAYLGAQDPRYTSAFSTTVSVLNGRLSWNANFDYQGEFTQYNALGLRTLITTANEPNASLQSQAIALYSQMMSEEGRGGGRYLYQTVNTLRLNSSSIRYILPESVARLFRSRMMSVSLMGSNLWLRTSYRGKDPNVNGSNTMEGTADFGQIPQPRVWSLSINVGN